MKKWAIWKTICVIVASILFISGVTVLGVYFAGGFKPRTVNPSEISFSAGDDEETLFNKNTNQYEITKSFQMTILGQAQNNETITNNQVTLSLDGESEVYTYATQQTDADGNTVYETRVRNEAISVPQIVTIGSPFTVMVRTSILKDNEGNDIIDPNTNTFVPWVNGGIANITATSGDLVISTRIAVDTPVYSITATAVDYNGVEKQQVSINERFLMKPTFFPANSAYLYNDQNNAAISEKRERKAFFESEASTNIITTDFDASRLEKYFTTLIEQNDNHIMGYTYVNASEQYSKYNSRLTEDAESNEILYNQLLGELRQSKGSADVLSTQFDFDIQSANIQKFEVTQRGTRNKIVAGRPYVLSVSQYVFADGFVGAQVWSDKDELLTSMLLQVAISVEVQDGTRWVSAADKMTILSGGEVNYADKDTRQYYFPDSTQPNPNYAFWTLTTQFEQTESYRVRVALFVPASDSSPEEKKYEIYQENGQEILYEFYLDAEVEQLQPVEWADDSDINILLKYDGSQTAESDDYLLRPRAQVSGDETVVFFAHFNNEPVETIRQILGDDVVDSPRAGQYTIGDRLLQLYPVSDRLRVKSTGEFEIYFATVRVGNDNQAELDQDGKYILKQAVLSPIKVYVTKTLYAGSVVGITTSTTAQKPEEQEDYHFYQGSDDTITIEISIDESSWEIFTNKLRNNLISVRLYEGNRALDNYLILGEPQLDAESFKITYTLAIADDFGATQEVRFNRVEIRDLENSELSPWSLNIQENYLLYVPTVESIEWTYTGGELDNSQTIKVTQTLTNGTDQNLTITYNVGGREETAHSIAEFLGKFSLQISDQYNNTDVFKDSWRYVSTDSKAVSITANGQGIYFPSTQKEETAQLYIVCGDSESARLTLAVTSSGIQKITYDNTTGLTAVPQGSLVDNSSLTEINIRKYGSSPSKQFGRNAAGTDTVNFGSLFALYLDGDIIYQPTNYKIKFTVQYLQSLADERLIDLFGQGGMITFTAKNRDWALPSKAEYDGDAAYANALRSALGNLEVESLKFNYDFRVGDQIMRFTISDTQDLGTVNIALNFEILRNISSTTSSQNGGGNSVDSRIYAQQEWFGFNSTIEFQNADDAESISVPLTQALYNTLSQSSGLYVVSASDTTYKIAGADNTGSRIGQIVGRAENQTAGFVFEDFWNSESVTYTVLYYFEGTENYFAPYYTFTIIVNCNIMVERTALQYYFIARTIETDISQYITVSRLVGDAPINSEITYVMQSNPYVSLVKNSLGVTNITRSENTIPLFGYNQEYLSYTVNVVIGNAQVRIASLDFKLYSGIEYSDIAGRLSQEPFFDADPDKTYITAQIEEVDTTKFIKVTDTYWYLRNENAQDDKAGYYFRVVKYDSSTGDPYQPRDDFYNPTVRAGEDNQNTRDFTILFSSYSNSGFFGLNRPDDFMIVRVESEDGLLLIMLVPVLVSRVGMTYGYYDGQTPASEEVKGFAKQQDITSADYESLIREGKFATTTAGGQFTVAYGYSDESAAAEFSQPGIYYFDKDVSIAIEIVAVGNLKYTSSTSAEQQVFDVAISQTPGINLAYITPNETGLTRSITINHLVKNPQEYDYKFVVVKALISRASGASQFTQEFYYVVRVTPDTTLQPVTYPYDAGAEYLSVPVSDQPTPVLLDEAFAPSTLHEGGHRFTIFVNDIQNFDIPATHTIKSVTYDDGTDASEALTVSVDPQNPSRLLFQANQFTKVTVVITRHYTKVVGGDIDYTFVVNDESTTYQLQILKDAALLPQDNVSGNFTLTVEKDGEQDDHIDLVANYVANGGASLVYNSLRVISDNQNGNIYHFDENKDYNNTNQASVFDAETGLGGDSKGERLDSNTLRLHYADYLDKDYTAHLYFFSISGLVGTLEIDFKGSVSYASSDKPVQAGQSKQVVNGQDGLFDDLKLYGQQSLALTDEKPSYVDISTLPEEQQSQASVTQYLYGISNAEPQEDQNLVYFTDNFKTINIRPSIKDVKASIKFTLWIIKVYQVSDTQYQQEQSYTFTIPLNITANIKNTNGTIVPLASDGGDTNPGINTLPGANQDKKTVCAGNQFGAADDNKIDLFNLFALTNSDNLTAVQQLSTDVSYNWSALAGGEAFAPGKGADIVIDTNQIASATTCRVLIRVDLKTADTQTVYQSFYVKYEFVVTPSVSVDVHYPQPEQTLDREYITDNDTLNSLTDLLKGSAPFAELDEDGQPKKRFEITRAEGYNGEVNVTLKITFMQNIDIVKDGQHLTTDDSENTVYQGSLNSGTGVDLKFVIGEWDIDRQQNVNNAETPTVTFQLECNKVPAEYTIVISTASPTYSILINRATAGVDGEGETFYADYLTGSDSANIFAGDRLVQLTLAQTATRYFTGDSTEISLLLEKQVGQQYQYKFVKGLLIYSADINKVVNIDLHKSYTGFNIVGAFENGKTPLNIGGNDLTSDEGWTREGSENDYTYTGGKFVPVNNIDSTLVQGQMQLVSRVELRYAGNKITYTKYANGFEVSDNKATTGKNLTDYAVPSLGLGEQVVATVKYNTLQATYSYSLDIDMEAGEAVGFARNEQGILVASAADKSISVNDTKQLIQYMNIYHPSASDKHMFAESEFNNDKQNITLEVLGLNSVWDDSNEKMQAIVNLIDGDNGRYHQLYNTGFNSDVHTIKKPYYDDIYNRYLDISPIRAQSGVESSPILNYNISATGAGNKGNYIALRMNYSITVEVEVGGEEHRTETRNWDKDFYFIVLVKPDYKLTYVGANGDGDSAGIEADETGYYVNDGEFVYSISDTKQQGDEYVAVNVAGNNGIVSVVHTTKDSADVSARDFKYTLTINQTVDEVVYNNLDNVKNKLANVVTTNKHWDKNAADGETETVFTWDSKGQEGVVLSLDGATTVTFGAQYYRLEAVDLYGFRFGVCFCLSNANGINPSLPEGNTLTEGNAFDIGVQYNKLHIEKQNQKYAITGTDSYDSVSAPTGVEVLMIQDVDAWGFDIDSHTQYLRGNASEDWLSRLESSFNGEEKLTNPNQAKYFDTPLFYELTVTNIDFFFDGQLLNASISNLNNALKTSSEIYIPGLEGTMGSDGVDDKPGSALAATYTMPKLPSWVYADKNEAQVELVIRIAYRYGLIGTEYFDLHTQVNVRRNITTESISNNVVRDGEMFDISNYVNVREIVNNRPTLISQDRIAGFYDDTLVVKVPRKGTVSLTITATDANKELGTKTTSRVNDESYDCNFYLSLSGIFETTLTKDAKFTITQTDNPDATFTYAGQTVEIGSEVEIKSSLARQAKDRISIEDPRRLNVNRTNITKYYLVSLKTEGDQTVEYRHTQNFVVTSYFYSLQYNYPGQRKEVSDYLKVTTDDGQTRYIIPIEAWTKGMYLTTLVRSNGGEDAQVFDSFSKSSIYKDGQGYLYFEVTQNSESGGGGSGDVTIDENGTITTGSNFNIASHYISVVIKQRVYGGDKQPLYDYNLTGEREFAFRLREDGTEIDLKNKNAELNIVDSSNQITVVNRYYEKGDVVYAEKKLSVPANATSIITNAKLATLWGGSDGGDYATQEDGKLTITTKIDGGSRNVEFTSQDSASQGSLTTGDIWSFKEGIQLYVKDDDGYVQEANKTLDFNAKVNSQTSAPFKARIKTSDGAVSDTSEYTFIEVYTDEASQTTYYAKIRDNRDNVVSGVTLAASRLLVEQTHLKLVQSGVAYNFDSHFQLKQESGYTFLVKMDNSQELYTFLSNFAFVAEE